MRRRKEKFVDDVGGFVVVPDDRIATGDCHEFSPLRGVAHCDDRSRKSGSKVGSQRVTCGGDAPVDGRDDDKVVDSQIIERLDLGDFLRRCTEDDCRLVCHHPQRAVKA